MAKNNKKKTKETKTIVENKEEIVDKKDVSADEENSDLEEKRGLIQNVIPSKVMNMFFSSWWAISAALALYLFFYAAAVHEETKYVILNQAYSISDINLLVFYTENARLLFEFTLILVLILITGFYMCIALLIARNFYTIILLVWFIISIVSFAFLLQKKIEVYMFVVALVASPIYIFLVMNLDLLIAKAKSSTGTMHEPKKPLKKSLTNKRESKILTNSLVKQWFIVFYGSLIFIMFYISVIVIFSAIAKDVGENAAQIELNSRAYKSNTPINIEPKYFEIEVPTVSCKDSSCIKFGTTKN